MAVRGHRNRYAKNTGATQRPTGLDLTNATRLV